MIVGKEEDIEELVEKIKEKLIVNEQKDKFLSLPRNLPFCSL